MQRDIAAVITALTAVFIGGCAASDTSERRCQSSPPREVRSRAEMHPSFCVAPAGSATSMAAVAAPRESAASAAVSGSAAASGSAASSASPPKAVAAEPAAVAPAVDPATCELDCERICGGMCRRVSDTTVECTRIEGGHPCGRSLEGASLTPAGKGEVAQLEAMFGLEAISAAAFDSLAEELEALDAPRSLVARARQSAVEERRHTELVRRLLAQRGVSARRPHAPAARHRTLFAIAAENAVEGCARETVGAAVALVLAERATALELRRFYRAISEDELRHAQWSWELHAWATSELDDESARALEARRRAALSGFARDPAVARELPGVDAATSTEISALVAALVAELEPPLAA